MKRLLAILLAAMMLALIGCEVDADLDVNLGDQAQTTVVAVQ